MTLGWRRHYYFAPELWMRAQSEWRELRGRLEDDQWIDVRYEDLVCEPEQTMRRVCAFLGVEYEESVFDYVKEGTYGYPKKELAYRWKQVLEPRDVQLIEARLGTALQEGGYAPSGLPAVHVAGMRRAGYWTRNYVGVKRSLILEEGVLVYVAGFVGRKLRFSPASRFYRRRKEEQRIARNKRLERRY